MGRYFHIDSRTFSVVRLSHRGIVKFLDCEFPVVGPNRKFVILAFISALPKD